MTEEVEVPRKSSFAVLPVRDITCIHDDPSHHFVLKEITTLYFEPSPRTIRKAESKFGGLSTVRVPYDLTEVIGQVLPVFRVDVVQRVATGEVRWSIPEETLDCRANVEELARFVHDGDDIGRFFDQPPETCLVSNNPGVMGGVHRNGNGVCQPGEIGGA
ncbi:MAG: hypothetical protein R3324_13150, partial [Halobacteriales archaeon]|nr:hypothetical protein [Halobacteriales archaeon]